MLDSPKRRYSKSDIYICFPFCKKNKTKVASGRPNQRFLLSFFFKKNLNASIDLLSIP